MTILDISKGELAHKGAIFYIYTKQVPTYITTSQKYLEKKISVLS